MKDITLSQIRRALAKAYLAGFVRATAPGYLMGWVHERICAELNVFLTAVATGESPRLMLCMPPRHGKSELASRRFPAYVFGRYPDMSIIGTSYSADLSSRLNRDVQRVMEQPEYQAIFPETRLSAKNIRAVASGNYLRNSDLFEIVDHRGTYRSAGVGGITGMGGDILIVDAPFKERAEADSPPSAAKCGSGTLPRSTRALRPAGASLSSTRAGTWTTFRGGFWRPRARARGMRGAWSTSRPSPRGREVPPARQCPAPRALPAGAARGHQEGHRLRD